MNITEILNAQHVAYERDLEPDNFGLDTCPFDDPTIDTATDITYTVPCAYCGYIDCNHTDAGSPFAHITNRQGW